MILFLVSPIAEIVFLQPVKIIIGKNERTFQEKETMKVHMRPKTPNQIILRNIAQRLIDSEYAQWVTKHEYLTEERYVIGKKAC